MSLSHYQKYIYIFVKGEETLILKNKKKKANLKRNEEDIRFL